MRRNIEATLSSSSTNIRGSPKESISYLSANKLYELYLQCSNDPWEADEMLTSTIYLGFPDRAKDDKKVKLFSKWTHHHPNQNLMHFELPSYNNQAVIKKCDLYGANWEVYWSSKRGCRLLFKACFLSSDFSENGFGSTGITLALVCKTSQSDSNLHNMCTMRTNSSMKPLDVKGCYIKVFKNNGALRIVKRKFNETIKLDHVLQNDWQYLRRIAFINLNNVFDQKSYLVANSSKRNHLDENDDFCQVQILKDNSSVIDVQRWLIHNDFTNHINILSTYTGSELLSESKEKLQLICGKLEGIRIYNRLHSTPIVSSKTLNLVIVKDNKSQFGTSVRLSLVTLTKNEIATALDSRSKLNCVHISNMNRKFSRRILLSDEVIQNLHENENFKILTEGDSMFLLSTTISDSSAR